MEGGLHHQLERAHTTIGELLQRVRELEVGNAHLHAQLHLQQQRQEASRDYTHHDGNGNHRTLTDAASAACDAPCAWWEQLHADHQDLQTKYSLLEDQHAQCRAMVNNALAKCRDYKMKAIAWKNYCDHQTQKRAQPTTSTAKRTGPPRQMIERPKDQQDRERTPRAVATKSWNKVEDHGTAARKVDDGSSPLMRSSPPLLHSRSAESPSKAPHVSSSQTTVVSTQFQDDPAFPVVAAAASSDSEPVVKWERSLKRKVGPATAAQPPARRIKQEPNSPEHPLEIQSDALSGPHTPWIGAVYTGNSDLDAPEATSVESWRSKRGRDIHKRATSEGANRPTPRFIRHESSRSMDDSDAQVGPTPFGMPELAAHGCRASGAIDTANQHTKLPRCHPTSILQPISANLPRLPRDEDKTIANNSKSKRTGGRDQVGILSEAGDADNSQLVAPTGHSDNAARQPATRNTLEELLNEPPPDPAPAVIRQPRKSPRKGLSVRNPAQLMTPESAVKRTTPKKGTGTLRRPRGVERSPPPVRLEGEPLRSRDLRTLKLEDFRINPRYLGSDFAFADTLRGRDQRRGLHTCTRSDCCGGALRKAVEMGGAVLSGKNDSEALAAYLGPQWSSMIEQYNTSKMKEVTMQAHAHVFAEQHGKHRQAFERRSTPPGFWRTDFPSTQETENDRKKALELERQAVEERYREALRPDGRWMFKDE